MAENDLRLLRMYKALLDSTNANVTEKDIAKYEKQVHKIDSKLYEKITAIINDNSNFMDYPLERQLEFLLGLEKEYNSYFEFQEEVKRICKKNNIDIKLHNIELINIDKIRKRINDIKKYLENIKQIGINNDTLGSLNEQLISLTNDEETFKKIVLRHDEALRHKVQIVNGRIKNNDKTENTSIALEASNLGLDLDKLLNDEVLLKEALIETEKASDEASEQLKLTAICNTDGKYEDLYLKAFNDNFMKKYKLIFLKIISLISSNEFNNSYDLAKEKRIRLIELIKERVRLLKELNVIYLFDPFNNLEINEQLKSIEVYSSVADEIREIVDRISIITADNDRMTGENRDFLDSLKEKIELIIDETSLRDIIIDDDIRPVNNSEKHPDNQVVTIVSLPNYFILKRAIDRARGVIERVWTLMNSSKKEEISSVAPNLVIEQKNVDNNNDKFASLNDNIFDDNIEESDMDSDIFLDLPSELGIDTNSGETVFENEVNPIIETVDDYKDEELFTDYPVKNIEEDLFSELSPFDDSAELFEERTDNGIEEGENFRVDFTPSAAPNPFLEHVENTSSDTFWTTKSDLDTSTDVSVVSS